MQDKSNLGAAATKLQNTLKTNYRQDQQQNRNNNMSTKKKPIQVSATQTTMMDMMAWDIVALHLWCILLRLKATAITGLFIQFCSQTTRIYLL